jgi:hypothetical protein
MKLIISIRRPEGNIEEVDVSQKFAGMNDSMFAKIRQATMDGGRGEPLSWKWVDDRTDAEKAFDAVHIARAEVAQAEDAGYHDPARICLARAAADKALAEWEATYPAEAAARRAEIEAKKAADTARIRNSDGYKAALEGRD